MSLLRTLLVGSLVVAGVDLQESTQRFLGVERDLDRLARSGVLSDMGLVRAFAVVGHLAPDGEVELIGLDIDPSW